MKRRADSRLATPRTRATLFSMTDAELHQRMKAYVMGWKETGEFLEAERRAQVRRSDTAKSIDLLDDAFESEIWLRPEPRPTSGMVEMQAVLSGARKK